MTLRKLDLDAMDVDELLRRGIAAARVGESSEARTCLTEATQRDPENVDAWLWLAGVETTRSSNAITSSECCCSPPGMPKRPTDWPDWSRSTARG